MLVKTFGMEMERGNPLSRKRLETRILHFQQFPGTQEYGDQYWRGYTYVWNDEQTDAELLDAEGADKVLKIKVGDKVVEQNYRFPSRAECTLCHTNAAKFALGVSTMQMNRDHDYDGVIANQLATLEHIGLFTKKLPAAAARTAEARRLQRREATAGRARPLLSALQLRPLPHEMGRRQRGVQAAVHDPGRATWASSTCPRPMATSASRSQADRPRPSRASRSSITAWP